MQLGELASKASTMARDDKSGLFPGVCPDKYVPGLTWRFAMFQAVFAAAGEFVLSAEFHPAVSPKVLLTESASIIALPVCHIVLKLKFFRFACIVASDCLVVSAI